MAAADLEATNEYHDIVNRGFKTHSNVSTSSTLNGVNGNLYSPSYAPSHTSSNTRVGSQGSSNGFNLPYDSEKTRGSSNNNSQHNSYSHRKQSSADGFNPFDPANNPFDEHEEDEVNNGNHPATRPPIISRFSVTPPPPEGGDSRASNWMINRGKSLGHRARPSTATMNSEAESVTAPPPHMMGMAPPFAFTSSNSTPTTRPRGNSNAASTRSRGASVSSMTTTGTMTAPAVAGLKQQSQQSQQHARVQTPTVEEEPAEPARVMFKEAKSQQPGGDQLAPPPSAAAAPKRPTTANGEKTKKPVERKVYPVLPIRELGSETGLIDCPLCGVRGWTKLRRSSSGMTYIVAAALTPVALCCIPLMRHWFSDSEHRCGTCGEPVALRPYRKGKNGGRAIPSVAIDLERGGRSRRPEKDPGMLMENSSPPRNSGYSAVNGMQDPWGKPRDAPRPPTASTTRESGGY